MKTRNLHSRLFTLTLTSLLPLLALASTACGGAPGPQGDEPVESAPPLPVEDGTDSGSTAPVQGEQDPTAVVVPDPRPAPPHTGGLRNDQAPSH
jgi:hypothetical protein